MYSINSHIVYHDIRRVLWSERRKCLSLKRQLHRESEEISIVILSRITQKLSCNSCPVYEKRKEGEVKKYELLTRREKYILCIPKSGSKSLQHPSTLPTIPVA
jgi:hypothetical protein